MKRLFGVAIAMAIAQSASAAPNVTNVTQKGSLLVFPDIRVDRNAGNLAGAPLAGSFDTLIRIQNDGSSDIDLKCYWMDGHKNRVDFILPITKNQAVWFDADSGRGSTNINPFPQAAANGFNAGTRHPFLEFGGTAIADGNDGFGPYRRGVLVCWVVDAGSQNQVKWNHLSGTATVYSANTAYEYNAYAFFVPTGADHDPVGVAGIINLNGLEYDACPLYQIGQFTPVDSTGAGLGAGFQPGVFNPAGPAISWNRLVVTGCNLNLNQDWAPVWTKLQFDIWNADEVKFTGAYECADTWHETDFRAGANPQNGAGNNPVPGFVDGIDSAAQNFQATTLATYSARYRVQGLKSTQCDRVRGEDDTVADVATQGLGLLAVQSSLFQGTDPIGSTLTGAGKFNGKIVWDEEDVVPEGGLR
ncbi:MAG: hypothetical protein AB7I50_01170 [Vicinamibacterales bacterium]